MAQLLIMYKQPADPAAFEEYYFSTHMPIFADTPGIRATTFSKGPITPIAGDAAYYLMGFNPARPETLQQTFVRHV